MLLAITLAAIIAPLALGGWSFSGQAMMPQFSRMNPIEGVKRMFALRSLIELAKAMAKFGVVAIVAALVLWKDAPTLMALGREPLQQAIGHAVQISGKALLLISAGLLIIAGIDVPYQLWQYAKQMRMSREEIREEYKESEGSPEVKGRIRQLQQQLARQRMMQEVPKADVVVTNPTHFAVALKYDEKRMRAPIVVAKGADEIAAKIREVAGEHKVPIFEAPPLARVLFRNVDIGDEIPATLYIAVAQILTYVFQLKVGQGTAAASRTSRCRNRSGSVKARTQHHAGSVAAQACLLLHRLVSAFPLTPAFQTVTACRRRRHAVARQLHLYRRCQRADVLAQECMATPATASRLPLADPLRDRRAAGRAGGAGDGHAAAAAAAARRAVHFQHRAVADRRDGGVLRHAAARFRACSRPCCCSRRCCAWR